MIEQITKNIWKITFKLFGSSVYLVKTEGRNVIIDTGAFWNRSEFKKELNELGLKPEDIDVVLLTHNHFDHTGNIKIFPKTKVYGSEIDFKKKILNGSFSVGGVEKLPEEEKRVDEMLPLDKLNLKSFQIIDVPGHTKGSVVFYMPSEKVLFSGDHIFENGHIGRTDLPNSEPEKMKASLEKMKKINYKILCAGH